MIYSQLLAAKFGWPAVIISIVLLPFLLLSSKLLAFPVWLEVFFKNGPFYAIKNALVYPGNKDVMGQKVYTGPTCIARFQRDGTVTQMSGVRNSSKHFGGSYRCLIKVMVESSLLYDLSGRQINGSCKTFNNHLANDVILLLPKNIHTRFPVRSSSEKHSTRYASNYTRRDRRLSSCESTRRRSFRPRHCQTR
jgi:hypothetical protein